MTVQHTQLAKGAWQQLSFVEQMANIGSEVERTIKWRNKGSIVISNRAFTRALELLILTKIDKRNKARLKELSRLHELLVDYFLSNNNYSSSDTLWQRYFFGFTYAARKKYIL